MRMIAKGAGMAMAVAGCVLVGEAVGWSQCSMCRTALESSIDGQAVAEGFRYGILFLLAAPYAVVGGVAVGIFRAYRKRRPPDA